MTVINKTRCCTLENQRLKEEIRQCDFCSDDWEGHHRCLKNVAKESGKRARACMSK